MSSAPHPFSLAALESAWSRVRANAGAPGPDGVTIEQFARDAAAHLVRLSRELAAGTYRAGGLRGVAMPKADGGTRVLHIPNIRDRVAQGAVAAWLSKLLDRGFSPTSFGYRPGRNVSQAMDVLRRRLMGGRPWAVDADIRAFFDEARHDLVMRALKRRIPDNRVLEVISGWLAGFGRGKGLAQGSPISPVLANLCLHTLDASLARRGFEPIRYADDFVIPTESRKRAADALAAVHKTLSTIGLDLNPAKTAIRPPEEPFVFLGERVDPRGARHMGAAPPVAAAGEPGLSRAEDTTLALALELASLIVRIARRWTS